MIVEFRFRNFRSFRDLQTLSFVATADTSLPDNVTAEPQIGDKRLVRAAVIYGANASGKSNVIEALHFLRHFVLNSNSRNPGEPIPVEPYRLDDSSEQRPSEFELTFILEDVRYIYSIAVDSVRVQRESLIAYPQGLPQIWFERHYESLTKKMSFKFGARLQGEKKRLQTLTRDDVLFLTIAAAFNHVQLGDVYRYFARSFLTIPSRYSTNPELFERMTATLAEAEEDVRSGVMTLLRMADLGIQDIMVERSDRIDSAIPPSLRNLDPARLSAEQRDDMARWFAVDVRLSHKSGKKTGEAVEFTIDHESLGTRRLFALSGFWVLALLGGTAIAVDELDASLHPLLVRAVLSMFLDSTYNQREAQLLFNTHDTTLLDTAILRRDQIWFVEKDREGASHLYPLSDFSPRKEGALERGYLRGRYGAIPFIDFAAGKGLLDAEAARQ